MEELRRLRAQDQQKQLWLEERHRQEVERLRAHYQQRATETEERYLTELFMLQQRLQEVTGTETHFRWQTLISDWGGREKKEHFAGFSFSRDTERATCSSEETPNEICIDLDQLMATAVQQHQIFMDIRSALQVSVSLLTYKAAYSATAEGLFTPVVIWAALNVTPSFIYSFAVIVIHLTKMWLRVLVLWLKLNNNLVRRNYSQKCIYSQPLSKA